MCAAKKRYFERSRQWVVRGKGEKEGRFKVNQKKKVEAKGRARSYHQHQDIMSTHIRQEDFENPSNSEKLWKIEGGASRDIVGYLKVELAELGPVSSSRVSK